MADNKRKQRSQDAFIAILEPGSKLLCDGQAAVVRMVTATSVLVHTAGADEWVLRAASRLQPAEGCSPSGGTGHANGSGDVEEEQASEAEEEDDECCVCRQAGRVVICDICPRVYHMRCLSAAEGARVKSLGDTDAEWWCPHCVRAARMSFVLQRIVSSGQPADKIAAQLYGFMSEEQHGLEAGWEVIKDVADTLDVSMSGVDTVGDSYYYHCT